MENWQKKKYRVEHEGCFSEGSLTTKIFKKDELVGIVSSDRQKLSAGNELVWTLSKVENLSYQLVKDYPLNSIDEIECDSNKKGYVIGIPKIHKNFVEQYIWKLNNA